MMAILQVESTDDGAVVRLHGELEVARMYMTADTNGKRRLHLEVSDTGEATTEMVLAAFRYAKAMGDLPVIE